MLYNGVDMLHDTLAVDKCVVTFSTVGWINL